MLEVVIVTELEVCVLDVVRSWKLFLFLAGFLVGLKEVKGVT